MNAYPSTAGWVEVYDDDKWPSTPSTSSHTTTSHSTCFLDHTTGTHTVRYQGTADWDCAIEANDSPVDVSLALPHYRTRHQPAEHKLSMFVATRSAPIRAKICRPAGSRQPFYLEVTSESAEVTLWLPSDFHGHIRCTYPRATPRSRSSSMTSGGSFLPEKNKNKKPSSSQRRPVATAAPSLSSTPTPAISFSSGFTNRILPHARINEEIALDDLGGAEDEVLVCARRVSLRMWDVAAGAPESRHKETWRRMFGCGKRAPETTIDWDFLLND